MKRVIYSLVFIMFFNFLNVEALTSCKTLELERLKELANKVTFSYTYQKEDNLNIESDVRFTITAHNLNEDLLVKIKDSEEKFTLENPSINNFLNNQVVEIEILAYTKNLCSGNLILTKTINLPFYNHFFEREECLENKDFKYCSEYGKYDITEKEFQEELEKYKINKKVDNKNPKYFLKKYSFYVLSLLIVVLIVGGVKHKLKNKKDRGF